MNKRLFTILLASLLLASAGSCGGQTEPETNETVPETEPAEPEESMDFSAMSFLERLTYDRSLLSDNLPEITFDGADYRISFLYFDDTHMYTQDWIADEMTGDILNDAVYMRNVTVEDRFDIRMEMVPHSHLSYVSDFTAPIIAGDDAFQMASLHPNQMSSIILDGFLMPLESMPYLDLSQPWWMEDANLNLSYDGVLFTAYGAATPVTLVADSPITFFNKDLAAELQVEDLYQVVREGRWTYAYFLNLINSVAVDLNGDGTMDTSDQYGLHIPIENQFYRFVWSLGGRYVTKDADGIPTMNLHSEIMEKAFTVTRELFQADGLYEEPGYSVEMFIDGNVLFEINSLHYIAESRKADFEVGLLPNFKLDETQEHYLTNGGGGPQCIPITCQNTDMTTIVMEALNAEGYKQVIPAYYETAVKYKMSDDQESAEMLDLIFSHVVYDGCRLFCPDTTFMLGQFVRDNAGFASYIASLETSRQDALRNGIAEFQKLLDRME